MLRLFSAIFALLVLTAAVHAQLVLPKFHDSSQFIIPVTNPNQLAPLDFTYEWQWDEWKMTWHVEDLTPADVGKEWSIFNQDDGTPFGFDFNRAVDSSFNHWPAKTTDSGPNGEVIPILPDETSFIETPLGKHDKTSCCCVVFR